jgi:hypothetical protein
LNASNTRIATTSYNWKGLPPADATWEIVDEIAARFPDFHLEDKVVLMGKDLLHVQTLNTSNNES